MLSGEKVIARVGKELFGTPYIGMAVPIKDETTQEVIGSVFLEKALHNRIP